MTECSLVSTCAQVYVTHHSFLRLWEKSVETGNLFPAMLFKEGIKLPFVSFFIPKST